MSCHSKKGPTRAFESSGQGGVELFGFIDIAFPSFRGFGPSEIVHGEDRGDALGSSFVVPLDIHRGRGSLLANSRGVPRFSRERNKTFPMTVIRDLNSSFAQEECPPTHI